TAPPVAPTAAARLPDFTALVDKAGAAVVNISTIGKTRQTALDSDEMDPDNPFGDFLRRFGGPNGPQLQPRATPSRGVGSGCIVSGLHRALPGGQMTPFIQTDVAVNPGNSGGPLLNTAGQVVGVNSQIYSRSGGFMGLSFAIPADVAAKVADQLRTHGKVAHGRIGVGIQPLDQSLAQSFGLPDSDGAL